jgi:hypothetical protein
MLSLLADLFLFAPGGPRPVLGWVDLVQRPLAGARPTLPSDHRVHARKVLFVVQAVFVRCAIVARILSNLTMSCRTVGLLKSSGPVYTPKVTR